MSSNVLVIDDESCILKMMELVLSNSGYNVTTAHSGSDGLAAYGNGANFDIVVSDYKMPDMTGIEVEQEMIRRDPSAKVIIVSGYGGCETAIEAMNRGATDFLRKPFAPEALRDAVRSALERDGKHTPIATVSREFSRRNVGGFNFELNEEALDDIYGDLTCTFEVIKENDSPRYVKVILPAVVQELIKAYIDADVVPCGKRFFQAMCEFELETHLREEKSIPASATIMFDPLLKRHTEWIDRMMTVTLAD